MRLSNEWHEDFSKGGTMRSCCKKEVKRFRDALHLCSCEIIRDGDYISVNKIRWAIEKASIIAKNQRLGMSGKHSWMKHLPKLAKDLGYSARRTGTKK